MSTDFGQLGKTALTIMMHLHFWVPTTSPYQVFRWAGYFIKGSELVELALAPTFQKKTNWLHLGCGHGLYIVVSDFPFPMTSEISALDHELYMKMHGISR